jgi:hypothetical protein
VGVRGNESFGTHAPRETLLYSLHVYIFADYITISDRSLLSQSGDLRWTNNLDLLIMQLQVVIVELDWLEMKE